MRAACCGRRCEDPDPVLIFEHQTLYNMEGPLADDAGAGRHRSRRRPPQGKDVSLITYGGTLGKTLQAAETLAGEGIDAEVIDLRSLRPLDMPTILASVRKTHRVVIVDEGWKSGSLSAEIMARARRAGAFYDLDAPIARVCSAEVPIPYPEASRRRRAAPAAGDRRGGASTSWVARG